MTLRPLGDRVVLKQLAQEETTKSGIVLPGQNKEKPEQAEVVAVGPGTEEIKMTVKVGDKVVYSKYAGNTVKFGDDEFVIVKQSDVLAVIEEGAAKKAVKAPKAVAPKAPAKKPGRKPAAAKTTAAKASAKKPTATKTAEAKKPGRKPAAAKTAEAKAPAKKPGRKPAAKKTGKK